MTQSPHPLFYVAMLQGEIYCSDDLGIRWSLQGRIDDLANSAGQQGVRALAVDRNGLLYAGTSNGLRVSKDKGVHWERLDIGLPKDRYAVVSQIIISSSNVLYIGTSGYGILKSTDGGKTWQSISTDLGDVFIQALWLDPKNEDRLIASLGIGFPGDKPPAPAMETSNGGQSWHLNSLQEHGSCTTIVSNPINPFVIYAGCPDGTVRSVTSGKYWTEIFGGAAGGEKYSGVIVFSPKDGQQIFRANTAGVWKSTDGGATWSNYWNDQSLIYALIATPEFFYVCDTEGVHRLQ